MRDALDAKRVEIDSRAGRVSYYVAGDGPPLLLIHSINAAASAYEVKPIFEHYRAHRRVYAPDLPGFGFSQRGERAYDVELYVNAVLSMLERIATDNGDAAIDALALSLPGEFLARAATIFDGPLRRLALVTPTGFRRGSQRLREAPGSTREIAWLRRLLLCPLWRESIYRFLTKPGTIRYFLRRTWGSAEIDEGLAQYDELVANQPGAEYAPFAFVSGRLFSKDIRNVYESLEQPVWLGHGTRGDFKDFSEAAWTDERSNWSRHAFDTGALPHFERPEAFFALLDPFLESD